MKPDNLRLCIDCVHFVQNMAYKNEEGRTKEAFCIHPDLIAYQAISGAVGSFCKDMKTKNGPCGYEGKFFEAFPEVPGFAEWVEKRKAQQKVGEES